MLSLDARRSKCSKLCSRLVPVDPNAQECALARRLSIQMRVRCVEKRSRSTPAGPNAFPMCSDALSLDTRQSKCISCVVRCALARRPSIQMHFLCGQMRSRSTPADPNAFHKCSYALSLGARRAVFDLNDLRTHQGRSRLFRDAPG